MIRSVLESVVKYSNFPDMLNKARFEIASSRLMETAIDTLEEELLLLFTAADKNQNGTITIADAEKALFACKYLHLTPFQKHILLGLSDCDGDGQIVYKSFAKICVDYIRKALAYDVIVAKGQIEESLR